MARDDRVIRASEIGQYEYCAHAWWLGRVRGCRSAHVVEMAAGMEEHERHGREVVGYHRLRWLGYLLLALAFLTVVLFTLVLFSVLVSGCKP